VLPELQRLKMSHIRVEQPPTSSQHLSNKRKIDHEEVSEAAPWRTVSLGSRKHLCINDDLRARVHDIDEACRELLTGTFAFRNVWYDILIANQKRVIDGVNSFLRWKNIPSMISRTRFL
jgi:hypothetical protein